MEGTHRKTRAAGRAHGERKVVRANEVGARLHRCPEAEPRDASPAHVEKRAKAPVVPCAERRIGRKAARGEHRCGRPEDAAPSVRILGRNARDASLRIKHEFPEGESLQDRHARIQSSVHHRETSRPVVGGDASSRIDAARNLADLVLESDAEALEPLECNIGLIAEDLDERGIGAPAARSQRLAVEEFRTVRDAQVALTLRVDGVEVEPVGHVVRGEQIARAVEEHDPGTPLGCGQSG